MNITLKLFIVILLCITTGISAFFWNKKRQFYAGNPAPAFCLKDETGTQHTLAQYKGQKVALVFYPKDGSPYCTKQAENMRNHFVELQSKGITILGISPDDQKTHAAFKAKYNLPFHVLSADNKTLDDYGVNGKIFIARTTFLVNEQGMIVDVIENVKVTEHAKQIINGFDK